ncbi:MAG TPA: TPM domain-containing protein [Candidatus Binatia bacterium]|nr:TPM domain-containing protein [Candidatus Binatia bacterium]
MASPPRWVRRWLDRADLDALARAIAEAERHTSAELVVHLERRIPRLAGDDPAQARARDVFLRLGLDRTRDRTAVLIYLALDDHRLAIVGDEGVHARVGDEYWAQVRDLMVERLRQGRTREALLAAIEAVGAALRRHFPRRPDDRDELRDRVTFD